MKKILMLLLGVFCIFVTPKVEAQDYKLTKIDQEGIYFVRTGGTVPDKNGTFAIYYLDGSLAYCVDPSKRIKTEDYVAGDGFVDLPYKDEIKEKMELYGYYGREYPGHDNVRYSMAAQSLIWQAAGVENVSFWTGKNGTGEKIDVTKERNEILSLVEKHRILPNLPTHVYADVMHETIITDSNKALDNFEVLPGPNYEAYINNNKLHITPTKMGIETVRLQRKKYDNLDTVIFVGKNDNDTQPLGRLRFSDLSEREITLSTDGVHIFLQKVDGNNNPVKIPAIEFKIKDLQTGEYLCDRYDCIFETDPTGLLVTNGVDFGDYQIEEIEDKIIPGYAWNSQKKVFTITEDNIKWNKDRLSYIDVTFKNHEVQGGLELTKKGEKAVFSDNGITYQEVLLNNVYFDLYDNNNKFIKTIITDDNGFVKVSGLKVGKYYLIEKTIIDGYVPNTNKINFEIKQTSSHQIEINYRLTVRNYLKKGKLEFTKVDNVTNTGIPNTIIEIYNENNKLLMTKTTDSSGMVIVDSLPLGKYYIKEKEANFYYQKTDEKKSFEINEDKEVVKVKMTNKKIVGNLKVTKYGEVFKTSNNEIKYENEKLSNIEFSLYDKNNKLIDTLKTDKNGEINKELELGKYYIVEKTKLSNYKENSEKYSFEIKKDGNKVINANLSVNNYLKKGGVEFVKDDLVSKIVISNTIMGVYNDRNELLLTKKTDKNGKIIINNLPLGKYYLKEIEANFFYRKTDKVVYFEIKSDGELVKTNLSNEKIVGNLEIYKKGENYHFVDNKIIYEKIKLHNIEFELYDENNVLISKINTDNNGYAKHSNLPIGKYYLIEKTNLDNYIHDNNKYFFEIKKNGENAINAILSIDNYLKKGNLEFTKLDQDTNVGIPDTIIEMYNDNGLLLTRETDKNGKVIINDLPFGKYYIREKEANYNYKKTDEIIEFDIKENNDNIKVKMNNKKIVGNLELIKNGEDYIVNDNNIFYKKNKLSNIIFSIYDSSNKKIGELKTNRDGYAKYSNLSLGKYYLIENTKLDNYVSNSSKYSFEIKKDGNNATPVKLTIDNYLKKGILEFTKLDQDTNEGIPNTIIEIYNDDFLLTKETDKSGKVIVNDLPFGKYYIREKEVNYKYQKTDEIIEFDIKENNDYVKVKMNNKKIVGKLEIMKYGEDYKYIDNDIVYEKSGLGNIEFELFDEKDNLVTTLKTNDDGYVKYTNIPLGKYYLIEKSNNNNYIPNMDKIYFEIKKAGNNGVDVKLEINNYLKKGILEFTKLDLNTNEGIPNTIVEIYSNDNKLLLTRETDELGKIVINNMPVGKYYIIEKEANSMYQLTNEKVYFEIKDNNKTVSTKMTNEKIVVPVPKTNTKEEVIAHSITLISFLIGIGGLFNERKKAY